MDRFVSGVITGGVLTAIALAVACGSTKSRNGFGDDPAQSVNGTFDEGGSFEAGDAGMGHAPIADPTTCEEAQQAKTYVVATTGRPSRATSCRTCSTSRSRSPTSAATTRTCR